MQQTSDEMPVTFDGAPLKWSDTGRFVYARELEPGRIIRIDQNGVANAEDRIVRS